MSKEIRMTKPENGPAADAFVVAGSIPPAARGASKVYDLEERTARFGEAIIAFAKKIPVTPITQRMIPQLVDAGTSIGANYCEADDAGSRKEFRYRISVCRRESRETKHWLRMVVSAVPDLKTEARGPLAGSEGAAPDLLSNLPRKTQSLIPNWLSLRHVFTSDFVIRFSLDIRH